ncbi:choloylglycine hydrolase family protein [Polymorphobacter arshaanensis]|uniref:Choloylglycine hydrolase family protein n=1 Tax=Glacieibacterium arshaanense TaxID=2511025 RepID=A0A4Y9EMX7_9SPHN|nr:choloylglycine hydrolase family protein [Polymorphobacter arshaanensis]
MTRRTLTRSFVQTALACATGLALLAQPALACTSLVLAANDGGRIYGRTMEFGIPLHSQAMKMPRGFANVGIGPDGTPGKGKSWNSKYAVIGANVFGMPFYVDGMNEAGLAGGMLNAPNTAQYQDVPAGQEANSIAPQQLLTYVLTNFATVGEVREALGKMYVSNAPMKAWGGVPRAHMTLHDAAGGSIVVEYLGGQLVINDNVIGVMTNDPAFTWHLANIGNYANLSGLDKKPLTVNGHTFPPASSGNGLHGIPGSMLSPDRFVRASLYVLNTPTDATTDVQKARVWHILNNFDIPYGSIYLDASSGYGGGANAYEFTEWTVVADLKNKTYSIRSFENPQIMTLDFKGFDLNGKTVTNLPLLK